MDIKRSPYTMKMTEDALTLTLTTATIEPSFVEHPTYEVDGRHYLQERFDLQIPSGADVLKINLDTYRGVQVAPKLIIMDDEKNLVLFNNTLSTIPVYPRIGVTRNRVYKLKIDDATQIDAAHGSLRYEFSYEINHDPISVEDYYDENE